jgi:hypothetical protein
MSRYRIFKNDEVIITIESHADKGDEELEECIRAALDAWIAETSVTITLSQMGDETSDVFLMYNGMELASHVISDYEEFSFDELKNDLFERFVEKELKNFEEVDEVDVQFDE